MEVSVPTYLDGYEPQLRMTARCVTLLLGLAVVTIDRSVASGGGGDMCARAHRPGTAGPGLPNVHDSLVRPVTDVENGVCTRLIAVRARAENLECIVSLPLFRVSSLSKSVMIQWSSFRRWTSNLQQEAVLCLRRPKQRRILNKYLGSDWMIPGF